MSLFRSQPQFGDIEAVRNEQDLPLKLRLRGAKQVEPAREKENEDTYP